MLLRLYSISEEGHGKFLVPVVLQPPKISYERVSAVCLEDEAW